MSAATPTRSQLGDVNNALRMMLDARDVNGNAIINHAYNKGKKIGPYLHHQGGE